MHDVHEARRVSGLRLHVMPDARNSVVVMADDPIVEHVHGMEGSPSTRRDRGSRSVHYAMLRDHRSDRARTRRAEIENAKTKTKTVDEAVGSSSAFCHSEA